MRRLVLLIAAVLVSAAPPIAARAAPQTVRTGFLDDAVYFLPSEERAAWLANAPRVGASVMRLRIRWDLVAPARPPADRAADPNWEGYRWAEWDERIAQTQAVGQTVLLNLVDAPPWAEGPNKGTRNREGRGSWMPDVAAFGDFATAVARRYDGTTPDVPRVDQFQIWNEPNLNIYLSPQYDSQGRPFAPIRFRDLLNAGYASIKAVQPRATVAAAGLAPYGDPGTDGYRTRPVAFLRTMLCLGDDLRRRCTTRTNTDAVSLHPYAVADPQRSALNGDDATIPDWKRISAVLRAARRAKTLQPRYPQQWVTEVSYDSSPPDPDGVPSATRARYIAETLYLLWKQNVNLVTWYLLRDALPRPSFAATYQSGMFLYEGGEKPDAIAFRFPTWIADRSRRRLGVWWRAPASGRAAVQVRKNGAWRTVKRLNARVNGVRLTSVPRRGVSGVRVRIAGGVVSYAVDVR